MQWIETIIVSYTEINYPITQDILCVEAENTPLLNSDNKKMKINLTLKYNAKNCKKF
jgi:hypothetical protein